MKKLLIILLSLTIAAFVTLSFARFTMDEELEIYDKTLRLHIPANSDSEIDQNVKLKVRDEILKLLEKPLSYCESRDEAAEVVQNMTKNIEFTANKVLSDNGLDYKATAKVTTEYYPEKSYGDITLPAGTYRSLKIELGKADGQNWWCMLFPQVCVGTAKPSETLAEVGFTANQIRILTDHEDYEYVVKFKLLEVLDSLF